MPLRVIVRFGPAIDLFEELQKLSHAAQVDLSAGTLLKNIFPDFSDHFSLVTGEVFRLVNASTTAHCFRNAIAEVGKCRQRTPSETRST
jgi:hypothetical protein